MRVPDDITKSVVFLGVEAPEGHQKKMMYRGTGFFVGILSPGTQRFPSSCDREACRSKIGVPENCGENLAAGRNSHHSLLVSSSTTAWRHPHQVCRSPGRIDFLIGPPPGSRLPTRLWAKHTRRPGRAIKN